MPSLLASPFLRFPPLNVIEDRQRCGRPPVLSLQGLNHRRVTRRVGSAQGMPRNRQANTKRVIGRWGRRLGHQLDRAKKNLLQEWDERCNPHIRQRAGGTDPKPNHLPGIIPLFKGMECLFKQFRGEPLSVEVPLLPGSPVGIGESCSVRSSPFGFVFGIASFAKMVGNVTRRPSDDREMNRRLIRLTSFAQHTETSDPNTAQQRLACRSLRSLDGISGTRQAHSF